MDGGSLINDIPERGLFYMDHAHELRELHFCSVVAGSSTHLGPLSLLYQWTHQPVSYGSAGCPFEPVLSLSPRVSAASAHT